MISMVIKWFLKKKEVRDRDDKRTQIKETQRWEQQGNQQDWEAVWRDHEGEIYQIFKIDYDEEGICSMYNSFS